MNLAGVRKFLRTEYTNPYYAGSLPTFGAVASFLAGQPGLGIVLAYGGVSLTLVGIDHAMSERSSREKEEQRSRRLQLREYLQHEFSKSNALPYHLEIDQLQEELGGLVKRLLEDYGSSEENLQKINNLSNKIDDLIKRREEDLKLFSGGRLSEKIRQEGLARFIELGRREPLYRQFIIWDAEEAGIEPPV